MPNDRPFQIGDIVRTPGYFGLVFRLSDPVPFPIEVWSLDHDPIEDEKHWEPFNSSELRLIIPADGGIVGLIFLKQKQLAIERARALLTQLPLTARMTKLSCIPIK